MALTDKLSAIGNAIRAKTGKTEMLTLDQMPVEIASIVTGGGGGEDLAACIDRSITSIVVPSIVTKIGMHAFDSCEQLVNVSLHNGITEIDRYAFNWNTELVSCPLPETLEKIGSYAFRNCGKLNLSVLPESLTTLGEYCFNACVSITISSVPHGVTSIPRECFSGCDCITNFTIHDAVQTIDNGAFRYCKNLATVTFEGTPTGIINPGTFTNCTNLTDIYVPWSEGAVAYAPWDATNATIHYNSIT